MSARYRQSIRVRYCDIDAQGVVHNANYLVYCEEAGMCWLQELGLWGGVDGWDTMVKQARLEWFGSAGAGEQLDVDLWVSRWGTTSFDLSYEGTVGDRRVFRAVITHVGVRPGTTETVPPPEIVRQRFGDYYIEEGTRV